MNLLLELLDQQKVNEKVDRIKAHKIMRPYIDKIAHLLFKEKAGAITDKKHSKHPIYIGVAHTVSTITDDNGKQLMLTFDNSTDSGEFEINSLSALMIQKGSDLDIEIRKLYKEHDVKSTKLVNYITRSGQRVIREIHLGKDLDERAVRLVADLLGLFKNNKSNSVKDSHVSA